MVGTVSEKFERSLEQAGLGFYKVVEEVELTLLIYFGSTVNDEKPPEILKERSDMT